MTTHEQTDLERAEAVIERGLQTFVEVGLALATIRDSRLYRQTHGTFEDYCRERWDFSKRHVNRLIQGAGAVAEIEDGTNWSHPQTPQNEAQAREVARAPEGERAKVWAEAQRRSGSEQPPARVSRKVVEEWYGEVPEEAAPKPEKPSYDTDAWSTPAEYVEFARDILGAIDCDPATNETAQGIVKAATHYTIDDDGLEQPWPGRVWLNPPYSDVGPWVEKLETERDLGHVTEAIVLVNVAHTSAWFRELHRISDLVAYPSKRINFYHPTGFKGSSNRYEQAFFYLGDRGHVFRRDIAQAGWAVALTGMARQYEDTIAGYATELRELRDRVRQLEAAPHASTHARARHTPATKNAYRALSEVLHPDKGGDPQDFIHLTTLYEAIP